MDITARNLIGMGLGLIVVLAAVFFGPGVYKFGNDWLAQNDIGNVAAAEVQYSAQNQNYASETALAASTAKVNYSPNVTVKITATSAGYCIAAKSSQGSGSTYYRSSESTVTATATTALTLPTGVTCPTIP